MKIRKMINLSYSVYKFEARIDFATIAQLYLVPDILCSNFLTKYLINFKETYLSKKNPKDYLLILSYKGHCLDYLASKGYSCSGKTLQEIEDNLIKEGVNLIDSTYVEEITPEEIATYKDFLEI